MGGATSPIVENHKILNDLVHSLDKTRLTTEAVLTACNINEEYVHISDVLSYNHYFGWYGGDVSMYGNWFDTFHKKYPNTGARHSIGTQVTLNREIILRNIRHIITRK